MAEEKKEKTEKKDELATLGKPIADKITQILKRRFIYSEEVARIVALAIQSGKNLIIYGPAGHGKSEMIDAIVRGLGVEEDTFKQFFGEGMDESRLYGGLDFKKLEVDKILEYRPENSFLAKRFAVFEELFDAPPSVLLALKDTLTAKELRNGHQRFKMKTEAIFCLTNKEPKEISDLGPAAHALIERFPLQLNLRWATYTAEDYCRLFDKVSSRFDVDFSDVKSTLLTLLAEVNAKIATISPRQAVNAFSVCEAACKLRSDKKVKMEDMQDLRFIPGLEQAKETVKGMTVTKQVGDESSRQLDGVKDEVKVICGSLMGARNSIMAIRVAKRADELHKQISGIKVTDEFFKQRQDMLDKLADTAAKATQRAMSLTRI